MEHEIMFEISKLLDKTGLEDIMPFSTGPAGSSDQSMETTLINVKNLNARYEKAEALNQVEWLMNHYNIQIDELMERISS